MGEEEAIAVLKGFELSPDDAVKRPEGGEEAFKNSHKSLSYVFILYLDTFQPVLPDLAVRRGLLRINQCLLGCRRVGPVGPNYLAGSHRAFASSRRTAGGRRTCGSRCTEAGRGRDRA